VLRSLRATPVRQDNRLLVASLVTGLVAYGYGLFRYPLYLTDEGVYMQRAWAVLRQSELAPYTYIYDHAPGGWVTIAGWVAVLPKQFEAFGAPINTGRVLMLLVHLASVYLLFDIARRFSGGSTAPFVATMLFNLSPLGIFYQRQVLLDNLMVLWLLLAVFLILRSDRRVTGALLGGLCFGMAIVTKENAVFFAPGLAYLLYQQTRGHRSRRFAKGFWFFAGGIPVMFYLMYATLKGELLPPGLDFDSTNTQSARVSLANTIWWQLNRTEGSPVSGDGVFWQMMNDFWLPKDRFLLTAGAVCTVVLLVQGLQDRRANHAQLAASLLTLGYAAYLVRGSVLLEFYVIPWVPLFALNIGLVTASLLRNVSTTGKIVAIAVGVAVLASPFGRYVVVHGDTGQLQAHDMYRLNLTSMQKKQMDWVQSNIPADARLIIDDDMWVTLREAKPSYRFAHSHYQASLDPEISDELFRQDWRRIDYIVMSNKMRRAMRLNGGEDWILDALDNHSQRIWHVKQGDVALSVYRVN
jgi:4-amino-4-deoxy-L-arabinose transferase-like glycosyltransferase